MKILKNGMYLLLVVLATTFTGCSTDDDGGDGGTAAAGTLTAKVDGTSYQSEPAGTSARKVDVAGSTTIVINANQTAAGSNNVITLTLLGIDSEGTYDIGGGANLSISALYIEGRASGQSDANVDTWQAPFEDGVAGELSIAELSDTKIRGTFSFTAKNAEDDSLKQVTEGSFNIKF